MVLFIMRKLHFTFVCVCDIIIIENESHIKWRKQQ